MVKILSFLFYTLPLASTGFLDKNRGWLFDMFQTIRRQNISVASSSVRLAMGVACLIIVFKMIKLSYDIMSDEQTGGFGGIRLWAILRPIVILILINSCTLWVGALDGLTNAVTMSISSHMDFVADKEKIIKVISDDEIAQSGLSDEDLNSAIAQGTQEYANFISKFAFLSALLGHPEITGDRLSSDGLAEGTGKGLQGLFEKKELKEYLKSVSEDSERSGKAVRASVNNYFKILRHTSSVDNGDITIDIHDRNLIPSICYWLYDRLYIVVQCIAEILLSLLAICVPWALVMSLMEPWKQAIWNFITAYVQISFWKVTASVINFITTTFRLNVIEYCLGMAKEQMGAATGGVMPQGNTRTAIILSAIVSIAGVFCLLKIQDITAAIIPSASQLGSASGGAATAKSAAGVPVVMTEKAAGAAIGGIKAAAGVKTLKK